MASGAAIASTWLSQWSGQLADVTDQVMGRVPDDDNWTVIRHFLQNVSRMLHRGDIRAGMRAFYKILPYVQRAVSSVEKCANIKNSYDITEAVSQHFLVDERAREHLQDVMNEVRKKVTILHARVEMFAKKMDGLLEDVILDGREIGIVVTLKLAFEMNRISGLIKCCEYNLDQTRSMLDALDTHVAGKSFLATCLSYICLLSGIVFSASGNVPVGAACITAATASRKSAQKLGEYRKELAEIDNDHKRLQRELNEWKFRFHAEQRNFLLLIGYRRFLLILVILIGAFLFLGKAVNFIVFAMVFMYLVMKSEETNAVRYYAAMFIGVVAMVMEMEKYYGLVTFNTMASILLGTKYFGFVEL